MDAGERRRTEAAIAKISGMKKAVETDPAATLQASLDASMANARRRLWSILFWTALAAMAASAIYFGRR